MKEQAPRVYLASGSSNIAARFMSVHGGLTKAVYAYPAAHYAFWQAQRRERGREPV